MPTENHAVRIDTLIALALSKRWPREDPEAVAVERDGEEAGKENEGGANANERDQNEKDLNELNGGLPFVLRGP